MSAGHDLAEKHVLDTGLSLMGGLGGGGGGLVHKFCLDLTKTQALVGKSVKRFCTFFQNISIKSAKQNIKERN